MESDWRVGVGRGVESDWSVAAGWRMTGKSGGGGE